MALGVGLAIFLIMDDSPLSLIVKDCLKIGLIITIWLSIHAMYLISGLKVLLADPRQLDNTWEEEMRWNP